MDVEALLAPHQMWQEYEPRRSVLFSGCACGLLYVAVPEEQEAREGILAVMHGIHLSDVLAKARATALAEVER